MTRNSEVKKRLADIIYDNQMFYLTKEKINKIDKERIAWKKTSAT